MTHKKLNPQAQLVLDHLKKVGSITAMEAIGIYRARSLSRRICDLKAAGHKIHSIMKTDNTGQRYARYEYAGEVK